MKKTKAAISNSPFPARFAGIFLIVALFTAPFAEAGGSKLGAENRRLIFMAGPGYDSNILLNPNDDPALVEVMERDDVRWHARVGLIHSLWRSDLHVEADLQTVWSMDSQVGRADGTDFRMAFPWRHTGSFESGKKYALTLSPFYHSVLMDYDEGGNRSMVLNELGFAARWSVNRSSRWLSEYMLELQKRDSAVETSAERNFDAVKTVMKKMYTYFSDDEKRWDVEFGYMLNNAEGDLNYYYGFNAGAMFQMPCPVLADSTFNAGLDVSNIYFSRTENDRKDVNLTLRAGFTKNMNAQWSWSLSTDYMDNGSNVKSQEYHRHTVLGLIKYVWAQ